MSSPTVTLESATPPFAAEASAAASGTLLVCLPASSTEGLQLIRHRLAAILPGVRLLLAVPEGSAGPDTSHSDTSSDQLLSLPVPPRPHSTWVLVASDYAAAAALSQQHNSTATLILGSDAESLSETALRALSAAVLSGNADVAFPRYTVNPHEALVSAALLYPLTHTLFGSPVHLPLPLDFAFTARAADRLGAAARRQAGSGPSGALLWPAAEAAVSNLRTAEVPAGPHALPPPPEVDLNTILAEILGSAFADIESKAVFWQRARVPRAASVSAQPISTASNVELDEITPMVESFRNAFTNLQQIWALVLPPHSLLALKKLSLTPAAQFRMAPGLWARTVYEFVLAFHLRTLNRGHLLGALTPLYLAWVASYLGQVGEDPQVADAFIEQNAAAFEAEKPYLVSRWRWPDRFNP